jgi:ubiquinone/menaquinone biosynthesis C-methylase UbiE
MDYLNINRKLWNDKTSIHYQSDFYDVESFNQGKDSLNPIEIELLGDISGKSVLHLQCHFGMDSISLARRGARVTGIDLSDESIKQARELNEKSGTKVDFVLSDVYSLPQNLNRQFDIVFTSYGTVGWLPDMDKWAAVIQHFLKPGGKFIMVEFHPVVWMFDDNFKEIIFKYSDVDPIIEELEGTYANREANIKNQSVSWNHGLATVINALLKKGLVLEGFQEYDYSPYNCFNNTVETENGKFQIKGLEGKIPMLYSVSALKKYTVK